MKKKLQCSKTFRLRVHKACQWTGIYSRGSITILSKWIKDYMSAKTSKIYKFEEIKKEKKA